MRIEITFNLRELGLFMAALVVAILLGLFVYGAFALLNLIHWLLAWGAIAIILTPCVYLWFKYQDDDIEILDNISDELEDTIE